MTPPRAKLTVPQVLPMVEAYYDICGNGAGGSLHIVLDDHNVKNDHVDFCIGWARDKGDHRGEVLAVVLRIMSQTQRGKLATSHRPSGYEHDAEVRFDAALEALPVEVRYELIVTCPQCGAPMPLGGPCENAPDW